MAIHGSRQPAAIDGPAGSSMATKSAVDGLAGPAIAVAGDHGHLIAV